MQFIKKHFVIISLAFIASVLLAIKILVPPPAPVVAPSPSPISQSPAWNGVVPGKTSAQELPKLVGQPEAVENTNGQTTYEVERQGGGPPHEIIAQSGTVELVKDRVLSGNISSFKQNYGEPEGEYWGEHQSVGFKTYVWPQKGLAVVAHQRDGVIFEVWYFAPTNLQGFLSTWGKGLSKEPEQESGY